jgi:putative hydrolase of the HAD superfamily
MKNHIKVIGFDADDTLWDNQPQFNKVIKTFIDILSPYCREETALKAIHNMQVANLPVYGFGAKSLALSMTQAACELSKYRIDAHRIEKIINLGKGLLTMPVELLDDAERVICELKNKYILVLITKGDLIDQRRKLRESGLEKYFHHIEVLNDKKENDYRDIFRRLNLNPQEFAMVGNSLKSDIIPVLELGATAVYIPYHSTWEHEHVENYEPENANFYEQEKLSDLLRMFL